MFQILLIAFLTIPILEIYLLFQVGGVIGAGWTIIIVIGTALLGASLLRQQGLSTLTRLNQSIAQGQLPPTVLIEGIFLLLAGAFLLTPGFFTDTVGFIFLISPLRQSFSRYLLNRGLFMAASSFQSTQSPQNHSASKTGSPQEKNKIIEGEYERKDD